MSINLFINYYKESNSNRLKELCFCINKNLQNNLLNVIILNSDNRIKFSDFFNIINKYTNNNDINIISNLDIYFDDSISLVNNMNVNEAFVLCRWDLLKNNEIKFANRPDSQDVFIFKGKIKENLFGDFYLGYMGCDNRLAYEISNAGYILSNPSLSIKSIHVHQSKLRNYKSTGKERKNFLVPEPYKTIHPCTMEDR